MGLDEPIAFAKPDWAKLRMWNQEFVLNPRTARIAFTRTVKSVLLVAKVLFKFHWLRQHTDWT